MKPFIKKFKLKNNCYVYDINSNRFFKTDEITWSIIDEFYTLSEYDLLKKWKNHFPKKEIKEAIKRINIKRKEGLFSTFRPKKTKFQLSKKEIREKLENSIYQLTLNPTERCNLRCFYCVYSDKYSKKRNHSANSTSIFTAKRAIDFYLNHSKKTNTPIISFYGGEPLLKFGDIKEYVQYVKSKTKRRIRFGITTNGTLLSKEIIDFLIRYNFGLTISLDGPKETHDRYRRFKNGKGTFDIILRNLSHIKRISREYFSEKVRFNIVLSPPFNISRVKNFFETLGGEIKNELRVGFVNNPRDIFRTDLKQSHQTLFIQRNQLKAEFKENLIQKKPYRSPFLRAIFEKDLLHIYKRNIKPLEENHPPNGICIPGCRNLFVDSKGNFFTCEKMDGYSSIGNIDDGFYFRKIFNLIDKYSQICDSDCLNCWAIRLCNQCFVSANSGKKLSRLIKRQNCETMKKSLEENIQLCVEVMEENPNALEYMDKFTFH